MLWQLTTLTFHSNQHQVPRSVHVAARATDKVLYQHESLARVEMWTGFPQIHFQWQQNIRKINCAVT